MVRVIWAFPFIVGAIGIWLLGFLAGLPFFFGGFGVYALVSLIPPRPRLKVTFSDRRGHDRRMTFCGNREEPALDVETIIETDCAAARQTMPRMPTPRQVSGLAAEAIFKASALGILAGGATDEELRKFLGKVANHADALGRWLAGYQEARRRRLLEFCAVYRVDNDGEAAAQDLRLRLRFPRQFAEPDDAALPDPPTRPKFSSGSLFPSPILPTNIPAIRPIFNAPLPDVVKGIAPTYFRDQEHLVVEYNLGSLNHGPDHLRTGECHLRAPAPGTYEVRWEISAANLPEAAHGTLDIEIAQRPVPDAPIDDLERVLIERENLDLG